MAIRQKMRCAEHVAWVVEPYGIELIHMERGRRRTLFHPEAAVWDLVTRGRPVKTIPSLLELIAGTGPHEARTLVNSCLEQWLAEGWLETGAAE